MSLIWENLVFALVAFGVLYWLLSKYAFDKLFDVMEKRRELVKQQLEEAAASRSQAQQYVDEQKQALSAARKEAFDIVEMAKQNSVRHTDEVIEQAKNEAARLKTDAAREIESEKNRAIESLRNEVSSMSVAIASKIMEKELDEKDQSQLVDQYLKEVGGKQ